MTAGRLWFVEVLVWILIALTFVCWLPAADRLERRRPFAFAAGFLAVGLALRYDLLGLDFGREAWFTILAFWFFAVGWAAAKSSTVWQRIAVTFVLIVSLHGYFDSSHREVLVLAGFPAADLAARDPLPGLVDGRRGHGGGGLAVHLPDALPGVSVVRRASAARRRRVRHGRRAAHPGAERDADAAARARLSVRLLRIRFPLCDKPFLHQGRRDDAVGADEASRHDTAPARGGR